MMKRRMMQSLVGAAVVVAASAAFAAQSGDDWDLVTRPEDGLTVAFTEFDNGLLLGARCQRGVYQVMIGGLPAAPKVADFHASARTLIIGIGDEDASEQRFLLGDNPGTAFSELPAPMARQMREGGQMTITVPGGSEDGKNLRYVVNLPESNSAIDQSLAACNRPLVDPRDQELEALEDDGLPVNLVWKRMPKPEYPQGRTFTAGFAVVTCVSQPDGKLADCVVETEHPANGGFGEAAIKATYAGRLENRGGGNAPMPARLIVYRVNYSMTDPETSTDSRIRRNQE